MRGFVLPLFVSSAAGEGGDSVLDGLGGRSEAVDDVEDARTDVDSHRRFSAPCCLPRRRRSFWLALRSPREGNQFWGVSDRP